MLNPFRTWHKKVISSLTAWEASFLCPLFSENWTSTFDLGLHNNSYCIRLCHLLKCVSFCSIFNLSSLNDIDLYFFENEACFLSVHLLDFTASKSSLGKLMPWEIPYKTKCIVLPFSHRTAFWTCLGPQAYCHQLKQSFQGHTFTEMRPLAQDEENKNENKKNPWCFLSYAQHA